LPTSFSFFLCFFPGST